MFQVRVQFTGGHKALSSGHVAGVGGWPAGSWEDVTAGLYFGTIKRVTVIA